MFITIYNLFKTYIQIYYNYFLKLIIEHYVLCIDLGPILFYTHLPISLAPLNRVTKGRAINILLKKGGIPLLHRHTPLLAVYVKEDVAMFKRIEAAPT